MVRLGYPCSAPMHGVNVSGMGLSVHGFGILSAFSERRLLSLSNNSFPSLQSQTKEQADLVVTFTVNTATPEDTLGALKGELGSGGQLISALQSQARVHVLPESLREVPPASDA